jgi:hypothetical protein
MVDKTNEISMSEVKPSARNHLFSEAWAPILFDIVNEILTCEVEQIMTCSRKLRRRYHSTSRWSRGREGPKNDMGSVYEAIRREAGWCFIPGCPANCLCLKFWVTCQHRHLVDNLPFAGQSYNEIDVVCGLKVRGQFRLIDCHGRTRCSFPFAQRRQHQLGDHMYAWPKGRNDTIVPHVVSRVLRSVIYFWDQEQQYMQFFGTKWYSLRPGNTISSCLGFSSMRVGPAYSAILWVLCVAFMRVKFLFHVDAGSHSESRMRQIIHALFLSAVDFEDQGR